MHGVRGILKTIQSQLPCREQGYLPLNQAVQSPTKKGLEFFQETWCCASLESLTVATYRDTAALCTADVAVGYTRLPRKPDRAGTFEPALMTGRFKGWVWYTGSVCPGLLPLHWFVWHGSALPSWSCMVCLHGCPCPAESGNERGRRKQCSRLGHQAADFSSLQ